MKFESSLAQRVALLTSSHMGLEYEFPVTRLLPASESSVTQTLPCCWALARRNLKGLLEVLTAKDSYPINWEHCCSDLVYFHRNSWRWVTAKRQFKETFHVESLNDSSLFLDTIPISLTRVGAFGFAGTVTLLAASVQGSHRNWWCDGLNFMRSIESSEPPCLPLVYLRVIIIPRAKDPDKIYFFTSYKIAS